MRFLTLSFAPKRVPSVVQAKTLAQATWALGSSEGRWLFFWHAGQMLTGGGDPSGWLQRHPLLVPLLQQLITQGEPFFCSLTEADGTCYSVRGCTHGALAMLSITPQLRTPMAVFGADGRVIERTLAFDALWEIAPSERINDCAAWLTLLRHKRLVVDDSVLRAKFAQYCSTPFAPVHEDWQLADGRTIALYLHPQHSSLGGLRVECIDLTQQLTLQRQINAVEDGRNVVLHALDEGVGVFASDGMLRLHNNAFLRLLNVSNAQPLRIHQVLAQWQELSPNFALQVLQLVTAATTRQRLDATINYANGAVHRVSAVPLPDGDVLLSVNDHTAEATVARSLQARLEPLLHSAHPQQRSLEQLAYALRTPLNAVSGFADMVPLFGDCNDKQRDCIAALAAAAAELSHQIDGMLDVLDLETCSVPNAQWGNVHAMIHSAIEHVQQRYQTRPPVHCTLQNVPQTSNAFDLPRVQRALMQVLDNAYKYTTAQGGQVWLHAHADAQYMYFVVRDNGAGFATQTPHDTANLTRRTGEGAGLGLRCVSMVCALHGGQLQQSNPPQGGAQVIIQLPLQRSLAITHNT